MRKDNLADNLQRILEEHLYAPDKASPIWVTELARLRVILEDYSKPKLVRLLLDSYQELACSKVECKSAKELHDVQSKGIKKLSKKLEKNSKNTKGIVSDAFKSMRELKTERDYHKNIAEKRGRSLNQRKEGLAKGRDVRNHNVATKAKNQDAQTEKCIRDYFNSQRDRKVTNKELVKFLADRGLKLGTDDSFARKVALIAAKVRRESTD